MCAREFDENKNTCPCQSGCPSGCPCPDYQCQAESTTTTTTTKATTTTMPVSSGKSVLILYTQDVPHKAVITDGNGKDEHAGDDFRFIFRQKTSVYKSCSITWRGEMFVFGGADGFTYRQISKLNGCTLERVGTLSFDHAAGTCAAMNNDEIYLCFNSWTQADYKKCRKAKDPMGVFDEINPTNHYHIFARLGASLDALLAIGSEYPNNKKVEMLEPNGSAVAQWRELGDYPFANEYIYHAPTVYHANAFYVVGGLVYNEGVNVESNIIGRLDASTLTWSKAGELNYARSGHGAIFNGDRIIVAGGDGEKKTESCTVNKNGIVNCIEQATLEDYAYYPEMFLVDDAFCKNT